MLHRSWLLDARLPSTPARQESVGAQGQHLERRQGLVTSSQAAGGDASTAILIPQVNVLHYRV